jgi:hypothetical protein
VHLIMMPGSVTEMFQVEGSSTDSDVEWGVVAVTPYSVFETCCVGISAAPPINLTVDIRDFPQSLHAISYTVSR